MRAPLGFRARQARGSIEGPKTAFSSSLHLMLMPDESLLVIYTCLKLAGVALIQLVS
jgi:hypothetical protein